MRRRLRYADIYNSAYRSKSLTAYIRKAMGRFRSSPANHVYVPQHIHRMVCTQSIVTHRQNVQVTDIDWALSVSTFMRRRAARIITQQALHFIYHPGGSWMRKAALRWSTQPPWKTVQT